MGYPDTKTQVDSGAINKGAQGAELRAQGAGQKAQILFPALKNVIMVIAATIKMPKTANRVIVR